jgi:hypothetical protein
MITLPEAEVLAARLVAAGFAARAYPSDRQLGAHKVVALRGDVRYDLYEPEEGNVVLAALALLAEASLAAGVEARRNAPRARPRPVPLRRRGRR